MTDPTLTLRPANLEDVPECVDVFYDAADELNARTAQPIPPRNPTGLSRLFEHLIGTDPELSWVATLAGSDQIIAFGQAHRRRGTWFLAFLFVRPAHQGRRIGRRLLQACLEGGRLTSAEPRPIELSVCIQATQPVSAALYADFGMIPRVPLYVLTGPMAADRRLELGPSRLVATPFAEVIARRGEPWLASAIDSLDVETLGYAHPQDHQLWTALGRRGFTFSASDGGAAGGDAIVGYGYAHSSGRIAPVAVARDELLPEALDHLIAAITAVATPEAWLVFVPGPSSALVPLMRAGMRLDGAPAIYCATTDGPAFGRYLPANFAIL